MFMSYKKSYPISELLYDPSLFLNIHVFFFNILFRYRAFTTSILTSMKQLYKLDIHLGEVELPLPIKDDMKEIYIFRYIF